MWNSLSASVIFQPAPVPFTRRDLARRGITRYALMTDPRYRQILRGVWIDTRPDTAVPTPAWAEREWLEEWVKLRGISLLYPDLVGSHLSAARIYGLPIPSRIKDRRAHVSTRSYRKKIERRGLLLHYSAGLAYEHLEAFDLPLVTVPQLMIDLAPILSAEELVQIGDAAISRQRSGPYTTLKLMRDECEKRRPLKFRTKLERALDLIRPKVDSPRETWLRLWIMSCGLPEPDVHPPVQCSVRNIVLHPDLGYPELKLAIEYEGDHHRTSARQFADDIERRQLLEAEGWTVLRVSKGTNMATFAQLLAACLNRQQRLKS
ncbi:hypothetical protein [Brevibacterium sp.]|uniref:hypothetical protein n=1 Tax=Brevibacterium sp. TaxID=1701 RepID=UPI00281277FE|nr:hypothetical protein [Brevibacterium sp.]